MSPSFVGTYIGMSSLSLSSWPSWGGTLRLHHTPGRREAVSLCSLVMLQQRYSQPSKCWGRQRWWRGVGSNLHGFGIERFEVHILSFGWDVKTLIQSSGFTLKTWLWLASLPLEKQMCLCKLSPCSVVVQSLSHVQLFPTPWTATHQASERLFLTHEKTPGFLASGGVESIWGQRRGLITQSFCVIKFY